MASSKSNRRRARNIRTSREAIEDWLRRYRSSGQTQMTFARENNINVSTLRGWIYRGNSSSVVEQNPLAAVTLESDPVRLDRPGTVRIQCGESTQVWLPVALSDEQAKRWLRLLEVL